MPAMILNASFWIVSGDSGDLGPWWRRRVPVQQRL